jgi:hypothetical protein
VTAIDASLWSLAPFGRLSSGPIKKADSIPADPALAVSNLCETVLDPCRVCQMAEELQDHPEDSRLAMKEAATETWSHE